MVTQSLVVIPKNIQIQATDSADHIYVYLHVCIMCVYLCMYYVWMYVCENNS